MSIRATLGLPKTILSRPLPDSVIKYRATEKPWDRWKVEVNPLVGNIHQQQRKLTIDAIKALPKGRTVLDLGCGCGKILDEMLRSANIDRITAIDINIGAIAETKEKLNQNPFINKLEIEQGDIYQYPFIRSFDCVVCIDVLSELPDIAKALSMIRDALKPGGVFIGNFVAEENIAKLMINSHGLTTFLFRDLRFHIGMLFSGRQHIYEYFGRKGYVRLKPYLKNEAIDMLEKYFKPVKLESEYYHWFAATPKGI